MTTNPTTELGTKCHHILLLRGGSDHCITQQVLRVPEPFSDEAWDQVIEDYKEEIACILYGRRKQLRNADVLSDCPTWVRLFTWATDQVADKARKNRS